MQGRPSEWLPGAGPGRRELLPASLLAFLEGGEDTGLFQGLARWRPGALPKGS